MFAYPFRNELRWYSAPSDAKTNVGCLLILLEMNNDDMQLLPLLKQISDVCLLLEICVYIVHEHIYCYASCYCDKKTIRGWQLIGLYYYVLNYSHSSKCFLCFFNQWFQLIRHMNLTIKIKWENATVNALLL